MRARDSSSSKQPRPLLPRPRPSSTISGASIATAQQSHQKKGLPSAFIPSHDKSWYLKIIQTTDPLRTATKAHKKLWIFSTY